MAKLPASEPGRSVPPEAAPPDITRFLDMLAPPIAAWLRSRLADIAACAQAVRSLRVRTDVLEAKVDDFLRGDHDHPPREPEPLSAVLRRLEVLERVVLGTGAPTRPTAPPPRRPPTPSPAPASPMGPPPSERPTVEWADEIRLRLLEIGQRGPDALRRERERIVRDHGLSGPAMNAIWARCQGKFRPDFVGRVLTRTPRDERVAMRNRLASLYHVRAETIIEWFQAWNGNGSSH